MSLICHIIWLVPFLMMLDMSRKAGFVFHRCGVSYCWYAACTSSIVAWLLLLLYSRSLPLFCVWLGRKRMRTPCSSFILYGIAAAWYPIGLLLLGGRALKALHRRPHSWSFQGQVEATWRQKKAAKKEKAWAYYATPWCKNFAKKEERWYLRTIFFS